MSNAKKVAQNSIDKYYSSTLKVNSNLEDQHIRKDVTVIIVIETTFNIIFNYAIVLLPLHLTATARIKIAVYCLYTQRRNTLKAILSTKQAMRLWYKTNI